MMRRLRWVLAVALVGVGLSLPAQALSPCGPGGSTESVGGGWIASAPNYPAGHGETSLVASPAFDPNLIYASNGTVVMRSVDAGCGWALVYTAGTAGVLPGSKSSITALTVPSSANNSRFVYVGTTHTLVTGVSTPAVAVSTDRGAHFTEQTSGLPTVGSVTSLAANPQVPDVAYVTVALDVTATTSQQLFATTDGGATWKQRTPTGDSFPGEQLTVHPTAQTELFAVSGGKVVRSTDGGASFVAASPAGTVRSLSSAPGAGGVRLVATRSDGAVATSSSLGESWAGVSSPVKAYSAAAAPLQPFVAVSGPTGAFLLLPAAIDIGPGGAGPSSLAVTAPTAKGFAITGIRGGTLMRVTVDPSGRPIQPVVGPGGRLTPVTLLPVGAVTQFPSLILPAGVHVSLAAGETRTLPYRMLVPRTPTPVDVLFVVDSTNSMAPVIDDLRKGISAMVNSLNSAGLNVRIGVGDFRDYPGPRGPAAPGDWPWRLRRGIGPVDAELAGALNQLNTGGGTGDGWTSAYAAMYQSTTGNDVVDDHPEPLDEGYAGYRSGSLRLAMLASDAPSHEGSSRGEPGPNSDQVVAALLAHQVHAIGLAVTGGDLDPSRFMRLLADGSQTFAPVGGVDCDGNGVPDLDEGAPLVCKLAYVSAGAAGTGAGISQGGSPAGLTAAVVGLASGIPDIRPVGVRVANGASFAVLHQAQRAINLRADNELPFQLQLHCPLGPGSHQRIDLVGETGRRVLATNDVDLTCGGLPVAAPAVAAVAAVAPPPAPAPAQPVPQPQPQPNPNPNPNPNPAVNINVNPGVADQQEQMPQLAMAESSESSESLSMSGIAFVTVAGLMACTAGGLALRRREQLSF